MIIENIKSPADVKKLDTASLETLAAEMRQALINKISKPWVLTTSMWNRATTSRLSSPPSSK